MLLPTEIEAILQVIDDRHEQVILLQKRIQQGSKRNRN